MFADQAQDFWHLFWQPKLSEQTEWSFIYNWNYFWIISTNTFLIDINPEEKECGETLVLDGEMKT